MSLKNIAIIGYGSQAKTWSLNLKESGLDVLILRDGSSSIEKAQSDGFRAVSYEEIKSNSSVIEDISLTLPINSRWRAYSCPKEK